MEVFNLTLNVNDRAGLVVREIQGVCNLKKLGTAGLLRFHPVDEDVFRYPLRFVLKAFYLKPRFKTQISSILTFTTAQKGLYILKEQNLAAPRLLQLFMVNQPVGFLIYS